MKDEKVIETNIPSLEWNFEKVAELIKLIKQDTDKKYSIVNYAPHKIVVGGKLFSKNGADGCIRNDIKEEDIELLKRCSWFNLGFVGENIDYPTDGSYSDKMLDDISNYTFSKFSKEVDNIISKFTINRLMKFVTKNNKPINFIDFCKSRLMELESMKE